MSKDKLFSYLLLPLCLYIYPMWDTEIQRTGLQKCTPTGYALHAFAELFGFTGGMFLLIAFFAASFMNRRIGIIIVCSSVAIGLMGRILDMIAHRIAARRDFKYDDESRTASWNENGKRVTYDHAQWEKDTTASQK